MRLCSGLQLTDVDVSQVARAVVDDLRAAHPERRIDLHVGPSDGPPLAGDPARIHQAILNLGANACTHTPAATPVTIATESNDAETTVSIIDHGAGIDTADRERIFLPFYRSDPSRSRDGAGGAGLGLAVTHQIAREHGGSVSVGATPTGGATFTLHLPATPRAATTDTDAAKGSSRSAPATRSGSASG